MPTQGDCILEGILTRNENLVESAEVDKHLVKSDHNLFCIKN